MDANGWVKVRDRMPEGHGEFWVWLVPHKPQPSILEPGDSIFCKFSPYARVVTTWTNKRGEMRFNCGALEFPTHWQPLPAPPEGSQ